jgi:SNF2-related domain
VNSLKAERRWCLTGTPIQNRLEDLGALVEFLKAEPFVGSSSKANFRRHIIDPLFSDDDDPYQNVRLLLRSLCLRRTRNSVPYPRLSSQIIKLTLSSAEKRLYKYTLEETKREIDELVSTRAGTQKYTKLLTAILRLRILCNRGTFPTKVDPTLFLTPMSQGSSAYLSELGCDLCWSTESLDIMEGDRNFCPNCCRLLPQSQAALEDMQESPSQMQLPSSPGCLSPANFPSPQGVAIPDTPFSTKLSSVVENIIDHANASKRFVFPLYSPNELLH